MQCGIQFCIKRFENRIESYAKIIKTDRAVNIINDEG